VPIDLTVLPVFVLSAVVLVVVPGPAVLFVVSRSLDEGRRAGLVAVLGLSTGASVHVACSVLGVSAILQASTLAFDALRLGGAAYLIVLGVRRLLRPSHETEEAAPRRAQLGRAFADGVLVNLLNPKAALFLLAFLPQFVSPARGHVEVQLATLGALFLVIQFTGDSAYALAAGSLGGRLHRCRGLARARRVGTASVYLGLGVAAALGGARSR
jgi:threonine/homoserine/homoserine lactone efflux protein